MLDKAETWLQRVSDVYKVISLKLSVLPCRYSPFIIGQGLRLARTREGAQLQEEWTDTY